MPVPEPVHLEIERLTGEPLVIENADRLAEAFFSLDRSSQGADSYDAYTQQTPPNHIEEADVDRINGLMRARSEKEMWEGLLAEPHLDWLAALDPGWDLLMPDEQWAETTEAVTSALIAITGPYRNVSVSTKILHLKRPALIPVLDELVIQNIGGKYYTGKFTQRRAARSLSHIEHLRGQALASRDALIEIRSRLQWHGSSTGFCG